MQPPVEVSAGLVFRDGFLLISQRPPKSHLAGLWEFPGGKRELQESWEQCLRRELHEELGCKVQVGQLYRDVVYEYPEKTVHLKFFICVLEPGEVPKAIGCSAVRWATPTDLQVNLFPPADAALLKDLTSDPSLWNPVARE